MGLGLVSSYTTEDALGGAYKRASDVLCRTAHASVRLEFMWRAEASVGEIARYFLEKLYHYGKAIGFLNRDPRNGPNTVTRQTPRALRASRVVCLPPPLASLAFSPSLRRRDGVKGRGHLLPSPALFGRGAQGHAATPPRRHAATPRVSCQFAASWGHPAGDFRRVMGPPQTQDHGATRGGDITLVSQGHGTTSWALFAGPWGHVRRAQRLCE